MFKNLKESTFYFLKFFGNPLQQAAILPSSKYASKAMVKNIDFSKIKSIIELGAGDGVVTKEILKKCIPGTKVIVLEIDKTYADVLRKKFSDKAYIENISAHRIDEVLAKYNLEKVDLIVSGLPFLPKEIKEETENAIKRQIEKGATFRFFTYMPPVMKKVYKKFKTRRITFVSRNIPAIWVYELYL